VGEEVIVCIFNPAEREETAKFSLNLYAKDFKLLAGKQSEIKIDGNRYGIKIGGGRYSVYKLQR